MNFLTVTGLIIRKPDNFKYSPGDYVFIKIPAVAQFEWHPFTISSAPEEKDIFTLHIRGVGGWTNRLYDLISSKQPKKHSRLESIRR